MMKEGGYQTEEKPKGSLERRGKKIEIERELEGVGEVMNEFSLGGAT
jgi:hypothetical protein